MEALVTVKKYDINGIKTAFRQLKDARVVLTWGEFADNIKYDRTYVSRVMNGREKLSPEFQEEVKKYVESIPRQDHATSMISHSYTLTDKHMKIAKPEEDQPQSSLVKTVELHSEMLLEIRKEVKELKAMLSGKT